MRKPGAPIIVGVLCAWISGPPAQETQSASSPTPNVTPPTPATEDDARVRDLLLLADRVKLSVESVGIDSNGFGEPVIKNVATVSPDNFRAALNALRLQPYKDNGFGTTTNPILAFTFFQGERNIGFLTLGYNYQASEYWISAEDKLHRRERANLGLEAGYLLRLWVNEHLQLQKILLRLGATPSDLRPDLRQSQGKK